MRDKSNDLAQCISDETGKSLKDALGEVKASVLQGEYWSGEGMRFSGKTLPSAIPGKSSITIRQPRGVAALLVPANTPLANIAWKVFPALLCGNTIVLKASEDAPRIALEFARISKEAGLPDGVLNVIQGQGNISGAALVENSGIAVISFTGSTVVGRRIAQIAGRRLARISLELGGKNPFVVCDDANIKNAVKWACLSAFSNAGQRCASASRILIFDKIYDKFKSALLESVAELKIGTGDDCDLGPVINRKQWQRIVSVINTASRDGGSIIAGGVTADYSNLRKGYFIQPTLIEGLKIDSDICQTEIFGPVATLHRVTDLDEAIKVANSTEFGLTAAIHTASIDRAMWFAQRVKTGVVNINLGTFGSEPHMPFGGFGASGNGTREPGAEALDVYSELKTISMMIQSKNI